MLQIVQKIFLMPGWQFEYTHLQDRWPEGIWDMVTYFANNLKVIFFFGNLRMFKIKQKSKTWNNRTNSQRIEYNIEQKGGEFLWLRQNVRVFFSVGVHVHLLTRYIEIYYRRHEVVLSALETESAKKFLHCRFSSWQKLWCKSVYPSIGHITVHEKQMAIINFLTIFRSCKNAM